MISDIQSMLNASSGKQSNATNNSSNNILGNTGTIAKLSSEIKLIENLSLIKFQGSESLNFQGKPAQLLHATSAQQPFTLVNTGAPIDISDIQNAKLNKTNSLQASLTLPVENQTSKTGVNQNAPQVRQADNLMLASRVVNLTVTSVTPATNNTGNAPLTTTANSQPTTVTPQTSGVQTSSAQTSSAQTTSPQTVPPQLAATNIQAKTTNQPLTVNTPQLATSIQTTTATVTQSNPQLARVSDGKTEFPILSQTPLKKGDVVRVMVDANNNMQVLPAKTSATAPTVQTEALKQSLPKQLSLGDMSQLVKQLHSLNETSNANLLPQTQQALKQLMQNMPTLGALTTSPEAMKQAIQTSGLFSESLLANDSKTQIPADLKLNLTKLKDAQESIGPMRLGSIPTEQIANAIERITTSQLRHFSEPNQFNTPTYPLHIELPIKHGQSPSFVQIEIDKDASSEEQEKQDRRWLVKLKFDFEETGRFDARASIQANKVGILFAAEDPETVQKLQKNLSTLKQQLKDKDIEIERLDAFQAKLDKEKTNIVKTQSLIDVRT
ncbi:MAG: flagellar hook-length control protein FliK [Gammaproteobacteria bacterium]|nr:flagellar hook-length control protein FliK [Gammaproteobacteria bacterium]MBU1467799.1 flagellar hook-length control protein FliK [Gammaproteobacteria bacterium]MBU2023343.1 flagellar hook-length control protein FliK [Gammaproteobacteria bacterium]MBU2237578.1 flagellar hook-length control protein FliK [Gammaproteobacteria bacterium]MBU2413060.1 flagellar hook-length control protein FliK [Gammaproteobacteria bacterium]